MRSLCRASIALHLAALIALLGLQPNARAQSVVWPFGEAASGETCTPVTGANTTFHAADKSPSITLSCSNLTITGTATAIAAARVLHPKSSGKYYFETRLTRATSANTSIGISDDAARYDRFSAEAASDCIHGVCVSNANTGLVKKRGSATVVSIGAIADTDVVSIALDIDNDTIWFRKNANDWNGDPAADPSTNTGGIAMGTAGLTTQGIGSGSGTLLVLPFYATASVGALGDQVKANFGDSAFAQSVPSGFTAGWPAVSLTPSTWFLNGSNSTALSGAQSLTALATGDPLRTDLHYWRIAGKYYVEFAVAADANAAFRVGLHNAADFGGVDNPLGTGVGNSIAYVSSTGEVLLNSVVLATYATYTAPAPVSMAIDLDNDGVWFRTSCGDWNGDPANDPATNVGGLDISSLTTTLPVRPVMGTAAASVGDGSTGRFGGVGGFGCPVPSGFVRGWPVGAASQSLIIRTPLTHW